MSAEKRASEEATTRAAVVAERAQLDALCQASLTLCERSETLALDLLAQTDPYGASAWDTASWEEMLDHVAGLHARLLVLKARLDLLARTAR